MCENERRKATSKATSRHDQNRNLWSPETNLKFNLKLNEKQIFTTQFFSDIISLTKLNRWRYGVRDVNLLIVSSKMIP